MKHSDAERTLTGMITETTYRVPCLLGKAPFQEKDSHGKLFPKHITVSVPGSKSITNRALLLAMLADGKSTLHGALFSDDSRHFLACLNALGFATSADEEKSLMVVNGLGGRLPLDKASLYVGSAGTAARFLTACLGVAKGTFTMDASEQMRKRPMAPLLLSLEELGCEITFAEKEGFFPFTLQSHGFGKDNICIDINSSSQFLSALLIAASLSPKDFTIRVEGTHGMAYIDMTRKMMEQFGVVSQKTSDGTFIVPAGQQYRALSYQVEPDVSAACYFYALAAILGISVTVKGVHENSLQGDVAFLHILEKMGCKIEETAEGICLTGPEKGHLKGITVDMSACSDQAITLSAIAPFADSPVTITGIGHIRHQESDRIAAISENLQAMGISCVEQENGLTIYPGAPGPALIHTHDDHRLAMGFSLTGLLAEGIVIENPGCCKKTFENYFEVLEETLRNFT